LIGRDRTLAALRGRSRAASPLENHVTQKGQSKIATEPWPALRVRRRSASRLENHVT